MEQLDKAMTKNTEIHVLIQVDQDAKRENLAALEDQKLNFWGISPVYFGSERISSSLSVSSKCTDCQDGNALTRQRKEIF